MPKPELYVIFTGNKEWKSDKIFLSKEFFNEQTKQYGITQKVVMEAIRICKERMFKKNICLIIKTSQTPML